MLQLRGLSPAGAAQAGSGARQPAETLVLYVYSNSDPEYERNLRFFVEHGMREGDGCHYVIVVQQVRRRRRERSSREP